MRTRMACCGIARLAGRFGGRGRTARTVGGAVALVLLIAVAGLGQETGLLGEFVPQPMLGAVPSTVPLALSSQPARVLKAGPAGAPGAGSYSYGFIPLGNVPGSGVTVAVSTEPEVRIWVDQNGDADLSNDPGGYEREQILKDEFLWRVTVQVEYDVGGARVSQPYTLWISANYRFDMGRYEFLYAGFCQRQGLLDLDGTLVPVAVCSEAAAGRYDDLSSLVVAVDANGDGALDTSPDSPDLFRPGIPLQVGRTLYKIDSVSVDGRRIVVERTGEAEPRPTIAIGSPAPDFSATTASGSRVALSDFRGKPVVLVLTAFLPVSSCPSCCAWLSGTSLSSSVPRCRLQEVETVTGRFDGRVELLVVATDPGSVTPEDLNLGQPSAVAVVLPSLADLYRRALGVYVIDQQGVISAMDQVWTTVQDAWPWVKGNVDPVSTLEIEVVLKRLLGGS